MKQDRSNNDDTEKNICMYCNDINEKKQPILCMKNHLQKKPVKRAVHPGSTAENTKPIILSPLLGENPII